MHNSERKLVISAVHQLRDKVTVADVVTRTGLSQIVVQRLLNQIAADSRGQICVSGKGDIFYRFSANFENTSEVKTLSKAINAFSEKVLEALYLLFRVSFGIALIASLAIIVLLFLPFAAYFRMMGGYSDRKDDTRVVINLAVLSKLHLDRNTLKTLVFWNRPAGDRASPYAASDGTPNLLLNCFSYLFGDGDPNQELEEKRFQLIAQTIQQNNFAVTAEQLAPFTDRSVDEAVLPSLVRFDGKPEVTESGDIVYVFDSLQSFSFSNSPAIDEKENSIQPYLKEAHWLFSAVPAAEMIPVLIIAGANIFGAAMLYKIVSETGLMHSGVGQLATILFSYSAFFLYFPLLRAGYNFVRNKEIDARNEYRKSLAINLEAPDSSLSKKLEDARGFQIEPRLFDRSNIIYDTNKDVLTQND